MDLIAIFIRSWFGSTILHIGAGLRYGFLRLFRRGQKVSYRHVCYGTEDFNNIDHADNNLANGFLGFLIIVIFLLMATSCDNRHNMTDNYSVFTYGEGLYGEQEEDYPIFVSKLGYKGEPPFIANVRQIWWNNSTIIIEQTKNSWWIITAVDSLLSSGDRYCGPLSAQQKDSIILADGIEIESMNYRNYKHCRKGNMQ